MDPNEMDSEIKVLQQRVEHLEALEAQSQRHRQELFDLERKSGFQTVANDRRRDCQFDALCEMLFGLAERTGHSREQTVAEYTRRWQKLLDERLRTLEDRSPNWAAHTDDRSEDEIPEE